MLCVSFPSLFALIDDKEAWVVDIGTLWLSGVGRDETLVSQEPLMIGRWRRRKASWSGCMGRECTEMWKTWYFGPKQRAESSRSNPSTMLLSRTTDNPSLFPSSCIWSVWVQPKISFFAWEATWGKTLTLDLIQKRGGVLTNRCFLCHEKEKTIDYLLLHCTKTRVLWTLLFTLFEMSWVLPSSVRETLLS